MKNGFFEFLAFFDLELGNIGESSVSPLESRQLPEDCPENIRALLEEPIDDIEFAMKLGQADREMQRRERRPRTSIDALRRCEFVVDIEQTAPKDYAVRIKYSYGKYSHYHVLFNGSLEGVEEAVQDEIDIVKHRYGFNVRLGKLKGLKPRTVL